MSRIRIDNWPEVKLRVDQCFTLDEKEKHWVLVGEEVFVQQNSSSYMKDLQDAMDNLIYLNGAAGKGAIDADDIARIYYTLGVLKDVFQEMEKVETKKV